MVVLKFLQIILVLVFFVSCQSLPVRIKTAPMTAAESQVPKNFTNQELQIDYNSVQRLLGLDRNITQLGYTERSFNTCQVGFGFPADINCITKYFVVIHFKLMCRDSDGTVLRQIEEADLEPLANQQLSWTLKNAQGKVRTDSSGYAQVIVVGPSSQKTERFRISSRKDFLLLRAGDIQRLIVPKNWCD